MLIQFLMLSSVMIMHSHYEIWNLPSCTCEWMDAATPARQRGDYQGLDPFRSPSIPLVWATTGPDSWAFDLGSPTGQMKGPILKRTSCLVYCSAVTVLKFLVIFEQGVLHFILH